MRRETFSDGRFCYHGRSRGEGNCDAIGELLSPARCILEQDNAKPLRKPLCAGRSAGFVASRFRTLAKTGGDLLEDRRGFVNWDLLIEGTSGFRGKHAWRRVCRGPEHGRARAVCRRESMREFPQPMRDFGRLFSGRGKLAMGRTMIPAEPLQSSLRRLAPIARKRQLRGSGDEGFWRDARETPQGLESFARMFCLSRAKESSGSPGGLPPFLQFLPGEGVGAPPAIDIGGCGG